MYFAAAVLLTVVIPITAGASGSASGNSASGNAPAPTKPNVVQMSTGIKLNSTVPTYFYADTVKGVIILSPDGMVKTGCRAGGCPDKERCGPLFFRNGRKDRAAGQAGGVPHCGYERKKRDIHAGCAADEQCRRED